MRRKSTSGKIASDFMQAAIGPDVKIEDWQREVIDGVHRRRVFVAVDRGRGEDFSATVEGEFTGDGKIKITGMKADRIIVDDSTIDLVQVSPGVWK